MFTIDRNDFETYRVRRGHRHQSIQKSADSWLLTLRRGYFGSRPDAGSPVSLVGDGPHGVIALYAAALDASVRGVALRQTVTDYRSLAVAERYTQPFGIYAFGLFREFDLPDVARAAGPRPVELRNPVTPLGEPAGAAALDLYKGVSNVRVRTLDGDDPVQVLANWGVRALTSVQRR